jgi:molybdopterin-guanine dinucleotide biosynthesis protein A
MIFDAVVLAGGRASRLGGLPKPTELGRDGESLLDIAIRAAAGAAHIVVVGAVAARPGVIVTRESPPFSGPVAALAAGLEAVPCDTSAFTLVLAADQPRVAAGVDALRVAIEDSAAERLDGALAVDSDGRDQYLIALYSTPSLRKRLGMLPRENASMRQLVEGLDVMRVPVPSGTADDVDTWQDAERLGVTRIGGTRIGGTKTGGTKMEATL